MDYLVIYGDFRLEVAAGALEGACPPPASFPSAAWPTAPGC